MTRARRVALLLTGAALAAIAWAAPVHLRATSMLMRFADPGAQGWLARYGTHEVEVTSITLHTDGGPVLARRYTPRGVPDAPGVVLLHGVHRLSIDEPRLVRFARAIAETGVVVSTPAIAEIAGYRVDPASIDTIGVAAQELARDRGRPVGIIGMSFAGGLALLAAADVRYRDAILLVLSIGGHDDLARVARFFAEDTSPEPAGPPLHLAAHPYGALVLVHADAEGFFPADEVAPARAALVAWLGERYDEAKAGAERLSPPSRALLQRLFDGKIHDEPRGFLAAVAQLGPRMARVSPHGHLGTLAARVFLLHGASDPVIPASEARWLTAELPAAASPTVLITSAIGHVELTGVPTLTDELALVRYMARLLDALR